MSEIETAVAPVKQLDAVAVGKSLAGMKSGLEITSEYQEIAEGEELRLGVIGTKTMQKINGQPGETVEAIRYVTEDAKFVINADSVLRSTLLAKAREMEANGGVYPVLIQCTGTAEAKGGVGSYKTFKVFPLG